MVNVILEVRWFCMRILAKPCSQNPNTMHRLRCHVLLPIAITSLLIFVICSALKRFAGRTLHLFLEEYLSTGGIYYRQQRDLIEASARKFHLHWYLQQSGFDLLDPAYDSAFADGRLAYDHLLGLRLKAWGRLLREHRRDDFRIEKDKCEMNRFFLSNALPISPILRKWSDRSEWMRDLVSLAAFADVKEFPVFLKACHLTAAYCNGTMPIWNFQQAKEHLTQNGENLTSWAWEKWDYRADDAKRSWRWDGNTLTDTITPGFFMQQSAPLSLFEDVQTYDKRLGKVGDWRPFELKVEVLWGRAYGATLCANMPGLAYFIRSGTSEDGVEFHRTTGLESVLNLHRHMPWIQRESDRRHFWLLREGHFGCVWKLAERVAHIMMIDQVRVDIFVSQGRPTGCRINEISLSSGYVQPVHGRFMARLWVDGHVRKWYIPYGNVTSKPLYEHRANSVPQ